MRSAARDELRLLFPAAVQPRGQPHLLRSRRCCAGTIPSAAIISPVAVHPAGRGNRADRADRRMGAARGLPCGGSWPEDIGVAVNLSPVQFISPQSGRAREGCALRHRGLRPDRLELEITESVLLADNENALRSCSSCRALASGSRSTISAPAIRRSAICAVPVRQDQDRPLLYPRLVKGRIAWPSSRLSSGSVTVSACRPPPRASRPKSSSAAPRRRAAPRCRDFCSARPLPGAAVGELLSRFGSAGTGSAMRSSDVA